MAATTPKYNEEQLVHALRQGTEEAFDYLYENYSGALYTVILTIIKEPETASDVLQEVFIKIWKQIGSYDNSKGRLFTWMMRISRNAAIDVVRSKEFRKNSQNLDLNESVYDSTSVEIKTDDIGLRKLVSQLKPENRAIVEMSYFEGYTHAEIAKQLGIPEGTVKSRLRAGLLQLKHVLNSSGY